MGNKDISIVVNFAYGRGHVKLAFTQFNNVFYIKKGKTWDKARDAVAAEVTEELSNSLAVPTTQNVKLEVE